MTDSDVLARAARALREAHTGEREGSGFTRARIMNTVHRERRRRLLRWAIGSPLVSVLLVGSAWAQSSGKWPVIWQAVASVFVAKAPDASSRAPLRQREPRPVVDPPATGASNPVEPEPSLSPPEQAPEVIAAPQPEREPSPRVVRPRRARTSAAGDAEHHPTPARPEPAPERDRELARFRAAHDLHFAGDRPRDAIQAYAAYLREYPEGRFVPEARYNGALDQIKVGNIEAARDALEPFSAGQYGSYRQREARELLEAIAKKSGAGR